MLEIQGKTAHILRFHLQKRTVLILGYLKIYFLQSQNIKTEFLYSPFYIQKIVFFAKPSQQGVDPSKIGRVFTLSKIHLKIAKGTKSFLS